METLQDLRELGELQFGYRKMSIYNAYIKQYSELKFEAHTH